MKKIIDLPALLTICVFTGAILMSDSTETRISSVMRRFIVGTEEEAIYVVSASEEVPVSEMETVSGNDGLDPISLGQADTGAVHPGFVSGHQGKAVPGIFHQTGQN